MREWSSAMGRAAVVLALALWLAPAAADPYLQGISEELQANLTELLAASNMSINDMEFPVYRAILPEPEPFDPRGMGMLYNVTPVIMDTIVKKQQFIPEGFINISDGQVEVKNASWRELLQHFAGPVSFVFCFLLFAMLLPIAGLMWCCCHMCSSKRRRRPFDRKHDACLRALLAILLIALLTLFLFGVVCSFATEQQLEEGIGKLGGNMRTSLRGVRVAINGTTNNIHQRVEKYANYTFQGFTGVMNGVIDLVWRQLGSMSNAVAVTSLNNMVDQLDDVQHDLREVQQLTSTLRFQAGQLNTGLRKVKRNLLQTLANCDMPACINLQRKHRIGELNTDIQYSQMLDKYFPTMPDVSELLNNVTALLDGHIKEEVADGQRVFADIQDAIKRSVDEHVPRLRASIADVGNKMMEFANEVVEHGDKANQQIEAVERQTVGRLEAYRARYGPYRRYLGLGVAVALLTMTLVLAWGLLCGVCGKRPDVYGAADCCNKGKGSRCLYIGMVLMFALGAACCVAAVGYFLAGLLVQRLLCDPLTEPRNNTVFALVDKFVNVEKTVFQKKANVSSNFTVTDLLVSCHANHTIYHMLQVPRLMQIGTLRRKLEEDVLLRTKQLQPAFPTRRIVILRDSAKRKLRALADSGLSDFAFDRILSALETNMTSLELPALARTLERTADGVAERAGYGAVPAQLRAAARDLHDLHKDIVTPMLRHTRTLNETAHRLRDSLKFNKTSLKQAVTQLLEETQQAEDFLNEKGADTVRQIMEQVTTYVTNTMINVFDAAVDQELLGRCGPYSRAFNGTRDALCRDILLPINGFWVSVGYCALLLLPLLLVCARLARLYLQQDPYPGPLVEAEYLYDAYADRDNVPLANAYKADKRYQRGEREARGRGVCGAAPGACGAVAPRAAADALAPPPRDLARRYTDMAPKHWEEGPPRYHGPATEYERPPPYYYPGPNDRQ